jgi:hypothetical protein
MGNNVEDFIPPHGGAFISIEIDVLFRIIAITLTTVLPT